MYESGGGGMMLFLWLEVRKGGQVDLPACSRGSCDARYCWPDRKGFLRRLPFHLGTECHDLEDLV